MTRLSALNAGAAALALAVSLYLGGTRLPAAPLERGAAPTPAPGGELVQRQGQAGVLDASGRFSPARDYRRIAAASTFANELLLSLCEPDRIAAFTRLPNSVDALAYRYAGKPSIAGVGDLEALIHLQPDLVLLNASIGGAGRAERLRDAGLQVFDLGAMRGLRTFLPTLRSLALLLGRAERGRELARRFERRMQRIAASIPQQARPRGLYLARYGDTLSGGTDGTSYHDVLEAAGIRDIAADRFDDWPRYTPEDVVLLDPGLIVTHTGMGPALCAELGLAATQACRDRRVIELDPALLADPGFGMLEAAERLFDLVHSASVHAR